jgi:hypothetical protein
MGIKYLKGIYSETKPKTTRPKGLDFPLGLQVSSVLGTANSANSTAQQTFDLLLVAGGGSGGNRQFTPPDGRGGQGGGGGAGGVRIFSGNNFSELSQFGNPNNIFGTTNFIPVGVGGGGGSSNFGSIFNSGGGTGGVGRPRGPGPANPGPGGPGGPGGSGGGAGEGGPVYSPINGTAGTGIDGQGCNGSGRTGGSAIGPGAITTSITGTAIAFGQGGSAGPQATGTANRGNGGGGANRSYGPAGSVYLDNGGSGIVAIRYRNPAAPTTPLATGGDCVCCTGGCIIHIFNSSGFLNVQTNFSIE